MAYKQYMCRQVQGLKIGDKIRFVRGYYGTDDPKLQALVERNDWFGHMIIQIPDSLSDMLGKRPDRTIEARKSGLSDDFVNELARKGPKAVKGAVHTGSREVVTDAEADLADDGLDLAEDTPEPQEAKETAPTATDLTRMRVAELRDVAHRYSVPVQDEEGNLYSGAKLLGLVRRAVGV